MRTRSVEEILNLLSKFIDVPDSHKVKEGLESKLWFDGIPRFEVKVYDYSTEPQKAENFKKFASVKYRGYRFYIPDNNLESKKILSSMIKIFTMMPTGQKDTPVLTLPVR